jgi:hypothetical protein
VTDAGPGLPADADPVAAPAAADNCRSVAWPITSRRGPIRLAPLAQGDMGSETPHAGWSHRARSPATVSDMDQAPPWGRHALQPTQWAGCPLHHEGAGASGRMPPAPRQEMVAWASGPCRGGLTVGRMPTAPLGGRQSHQCQQHTVGDGFTPSRATAAATMKRIGSTHRLTPTLRERRQLRSLWLPSIQERSGPRPARWPGSRTVAGNRDRCGPRAAG